MGVEDCILAAMTGFIVSWLANALSKGRYSFASNLFTGISGAILLSYFIHIIAIWPDRFFVTLYTSAAGSAALLVLFHLTRALEKTKIPR